MVILIPNMYTVLGSKLRCNQLPNKYTTKLQNLMPRLHPTRLPELIQPDGNTLFHAYNGCMPIFPTGLAQECSSFHATLGGSVYSCHWAQKPVPMMVGHCLCELVLPYSLHEATVGIIVEVFLSC